MPGNPGFYGILIPFEKVPIPLGHKYKAQLHSPYIPFPYHKLHSQHQQRTDPQACKYKADDMETIYSG